jgi:mRNA interferase MazF
VSSEHSFRPWEVVVVPFPYSERLADKRRPALVISNERLHREGYLWIAMITGAGKENRPGDVPIRDLQIAGLPGASMVRVSKLATIEPARILRSVGSLATGERARVGKTIAGFLRSGPLLLPIRRPRLGSVSV